MCEVCHEFNERDSSRQKAEDGGGQEARIHAKWEKWVEGSIAPLSFYGVRTLCRISVWERAEPNQESLAKD